MIIDVVEHNNASITVSEEEEDGAYSRCQGIGLGDREKNEDQGVENLEKDRSLEIAVDVLPDPVDHGAGEAKEEEVKEAGENQTKFHFHNITMVGKQNDNINNPHNAENDFNSSDDEALYLENSLDGVEIPLNIFLPQHQVKDQP